MKKLPIILSALLLLCGTAHAANAGDVIGDIYSTDIVADVNGAPIRSFSLNGKTAIIAEDLRRYGFEVGYNDNLRALYVSVLENTFNPVPDDVERGKCGEIVGHIYQSDIITSINGTKVPCFSLNGEMAVAIEDIGGDITQTDRCETGMMYRWDAENRTISLLPDYDNGVQAEIIFNQYNARPYIGSGVLKYTAGLSGHGIETAVPDGSFKYSVHWGSEDGEIIGYVCDVKKDEPVHLEDGTWTMTSNRRSITHFDIDALYRLVNAEKIENLSYDEVLKRETDRLTADGAPPEEYTFGDLGAILQRGTDITIIQKSTDGSDGKEKYIGTAMRLNDFLPAQLTAERPCITDWEFAGAVQTDAYNGSFGNPGFETNGNTGCFFTYKSGGRYYEVFASMFGYFEYLEAVPRETDIGTVYSLASTAPPVAGRFEHEVNLTVGDRTSTLPAISYISGMFGPWVPAKDLAELLGGTAAVSEDGFTVEITTDKNQHEISSEHIVPENPSMCGKTLFETRAENCNTPLNLKSRITVDGKEISFEVKRSVSTAGMSTREITAELPAYIYGGRVYIPLEIIQNFYNSKAEN